MNQLQLFKQRHDSELTDEEAYSEMKNFDWIKGSPGELADFFSETIKRLDRLIWARVDKGLDYLDLRRLYDIALRRLEEENRNYDGKNPGYEDDKKPTVKAVDKGAGNKRIVTEKLNRVGMYYEFEIGYHVGLEKWAVDVEWTIPVNGDRKECYGNIRGTGKTLEEAISWVEDNYYCKIILEAN